LVLCLFAGLGSLSCGNNINSSTTSNVVTITITPTNATVGLAGTVQFKAVASGCTNTNVTWEVNGIVGGNSVYGTVSGSGLYTAPAKFSTPTTVTITAVSQCNANYLANVPVTLSSGVTVSVSPSSANLQLGQTQQFAATVDGNTNTAVNWLAGGVAGGNSTYGTISSSGLYTAPSTLPTTPTAVAVTAVSQVDSSKAGTASVILHGGVSVTLAPSPATVATFGSQQFTATLSGTSNTGITWEVNGVVGGSTATGTISSTGLFSAPNSVPTKASNGKSVESTVTVVAISQADSTAGATATVTIRPPNQARQKTPISLGVSGSIAGDTGGAGSSATCCGGTLGALVSRGGNQYILGSSHVLARNDDGSVGDTIIQPGLIDSSCSTVDTTAVANLSQFVNLESPPTATPFVDAALAKVISGQVDPAGTVLQLGGTTENGQPTDAPPRAGMGVAPSLGLAIAKSGRTTGLTCSPITAINGVVTVQYQKACGTGSSFTATFSDLVIVGIPSGSTGQSFSSEGDSGSLLVTQDASDPVALLVASSDTDTVAAPVSDVLAALADPSTGEQPVFVGTASTHAVAACSLPGPQVTTAAATAPLTAALTAEKLQAAAAIRDLHAAELLGHSQVRAIGVGPSLDQPGEAAILLVVRKGASLASLPSQVDGQRTRIISAGDIAREGVLTVAESVSLAEGSYPSNSVAALPDSEVSRARKVQAAHLASLMKSNGIQGVAITSSADNPSEAALLVLVVRGTTHEAIPSVLDGLRTRIRESAPFRSDRRSTSSKSACTQVKSSRVEKQSSY
jgi:hypothetical protein